MMDKKKCSFSYIWSLGVFMVCFLFGSISTSLYAQNSGNVYQLFLWMKSGVKTGYLLSEEPEFSYSDDVVHFRTKNMTLDIARDDFDKFTIELVPEPKWVFYLWLRNGRKVGYGIDEKPEVTLGNSTFTLSTSNLTIQYQADQVLQFTLEDASAVTHEDINQDKYIDSQDVLGIYEFMREAKPVRPSTVYDVNHDGVVDSQDVLRVYEGIKTK